VIRPNAKISKSLCSSLALLALLATPVAADERPPEYEAAYKAGTELFANDDYAAAREQFLAAYDIHPEPLLLLNIGSTYRREGKLGEALEYYQLFLGKAEAANEYRAQVTQIIAELEQEIADAEPREGREAQAAKPSSPPDRARVVEPAPAPADPAKAGRGMRIGGLIAAGVGVVALGVGVQQGMHARSIHDELEDKMTGTEWTQEVQDRFDRGESAETRAIVLSIGGGVALATGVTLYLLGRNRDDAEQRSRVTVAPYTDGTSTGFAVVGSF